MTKVMQNKHKTDRAAKSTQRAAATSSQKDRKAIKPAERAKAKFGVHHVGGSVGKLAGIKFNTLQDFNCGSIGILTAAKGNSPWERHPDSDKFMHVLEGSVTLRLLTADGDIEVEVDEGCCFVVPQGLWHRHEVHDQLKALFVSPGTTEHSKEDPRGKEAPAKTTLAKPLTTKNLPDAIREYALSLPETHEDQPWGHPAFKVKNKSFVFMGFTEKGITFSVKLTHSLFESLALPFVEPTGYGLGKSGWVTATIEGKNTIPPGTVNQWIAESYANVAPKSILKQMNTTIKPNVSSKTKSATKKR